MKRLFFFALFIMAGASTAGLFAQTYTYGTPDQTDVTLDFSTNEPVTITFPFQHDDPNFNINDLYWRWQTADGERYIKKSPLGWTPSTPSVPEFHLVKENAADISFGSNYVKLTLRPSLFNVTRPFFLEAGHTQEVVFTMKKGWDNYFKGANPRVRFRAIGAPAAPTAWPGYSKMTATAYPELTWPEWPNSNRYTVFVKGKFANFEGTVTSEYERYTSSYIGEGLIDRTSWYIRYLPYYGNVAPTYRPLIPGQTYTVDLQVENQAGVSAKVRLGTMQYKEALTMKSGATTDFQADVVRGCDDEVLFEMDVKEINPDLDLSRLSFVITTQFSYTDRRSWDGALWHSSDEPIARLFYNEDAGAWPSFTLDPVRKKLIFRRGPDTFPERFWWTGYNSPPASNRRLLVRMYYHDSIPGSVTYNQVRDDRGVDWSATFTLNNLTMPQPIQDDLPECWTTDQAAEVTWTQDPNAADYLVRITRFDGPDDQVGTPLEPIAVTAARFQFTKPDPFDPNWEPAPGQVVLEPAPKRHRIEVAARASVACVTPFHDMGSLEFIPASTWHPTRMVLPTGSQPIPWPFVQEPGGGYQTEGGTFEFQVDYPQNAQIPPDPECPDLRVRQKLTFYYKTSETGGTNIPANCPVSDIPYAFANIIRPAGLTTVDDNGNVILRRKFTSTLQAGEMRLVIELLRQRLGYCLGTPPEFEDMGDKTFYVGGELVLVDVSDYANPVIVRRYAKEAGRPGDLIKFQLQDNTNEVNWISLLPPSVAEVNVPGQGDDTYCTHEGETPIRVSFPIQAIGSKPGFPDEPYADRFRILVRQEVEPPLDFVPGPDWQQHYFWDGTHWVVPRISTDPDVEPNDDYKVGWQYLVLGNHSGYSTGGGQGTIGNSGSDFTRGIRVEWGEDSATMFAELPPCKLRKFFDLGEEDCESVSVQFGLTLLSSSEDTPQIGEAPPLEEVYFQPLKLNKAGAGRVSSIALAEPDFQEVEVVIGQAEGLTQFDLPINSTSTCDGDAAAHPNQFSWVIWRNQAGLDDPENPTHSWNGEAWVLGEQVFAFGNNTDSTTAPIPPDFHKRSLIHWAEQRIEAVFQSNNMTANFFPSGQNRQNAKIELRLDPNISPEGPGGWETPSSMEDPVFEILVSNRINVTFKKVIPVEALNWDDPMTFLDGLAQVSESYPPEPIPILTPSASLLIGEDVTSLYAASEFPKTEGDYAFLEFLSGNGVTEVLTFLAPYHPNNDAVGTVFHYTGRTPLAFNKTVVMNAKANWVTQNNLAYRVYAHANDGRVRAVVVMFVPSTQVKRQMTLLPKPSDGGNGVANHVPVSQMLERTSSSHNRSISISYLDELGDGDAADKRILYSVAFSDLLGRPQEVRAIGSYTSAGLPGDHMLVSGITELDEFGRQVRATKGFYQTLSGGQTSNPDFGLNLYQTGARSQTYQAAKNFWSSGGDSKRTLPGSNMPYAEGSQVPYAETIYEKDARGRILAQFPMGVKSGAALPQDAADMPKLRYTRFHYFTVPAPNLQQMSGILSQEYEGETESFSVALDNLDANTAGGAVLRGKLEVDANGHAVATFTGRDPDVVLITVTNPSRALLNDWGLETPVVGQGTKEHEQEGGPESVEDMDSRKVFLPYDYDTRTEGFQNMVSLQYIDDHGRLRASFSPKSIRLSSSGGAWWLAYRENGLFTEFRHDNKGRVVLTLEPDAKGSRVMYDDRDRPRFTQSAKQKKSAVWTELVYDQLDQLVMTRVVRVQDNPALVGDDVPSLEQTNRNLTNPEVLGVVKDSTIVTRYDTYSTDLKPRSYNDSGEKSTSEFKSYWPTREELLATYPYADDGGEQPIFSPPYGLASEVVGPASAERFYYNAKGLPVCKVLLFRDLAEPHITWSKYDTNDRVTDVYYHNAGQAYAYSYDAWDNLTGVFDRTPAPVHYNLRVAKSGLRKPVTLEAGPLKDASAGHSYTAAQPLTEYVHTPTGHPARIKHGGGTVQEDRTYDIRERLNRSEMKNLLTVQDLYKAELSYEAAGEAAWPMYNGMISGVTETYAGSLGEGETITHDYLYDGMMQLTGVTSTWPSADPNHPETDRVIQQAYTYDVNGNRLTEKRNFKREGESFTTVDQFNLTHTITDRTNQLEKVVRTSKTSHRAIEETVMDQITYDESGSMTKMVRIDDEGDTLSQTLTYGDPLHEILPTRIMQDLVNDSGDASKKATLTSVYDSTGTRIKRVLEQRNSEDQALAPKVTHYVPSGTENLAELDQYGRISRLYLFGGVERLGYKTSKDTVVYVKDHLGSTKATISAARNGRPAVMLASDTDAYGIPLREAYNPNELIAGEQEPHGFTGQEKEPLVGLMYYGGRWYMPEGGRFMSVDPEREFWNTYSYGGNNPTNGTDPDGKFWHIVLGAAAGAAVGAGFELIGQYHQLASGEISEINWSAVGGGAVQGSIVGGTAAATGGTSLLTQAGSLAAANVVGGVINRSIDNDDHTSAFDMTTITIDGVSGGVSGAASALLEPVIATKITGSLAQRVATRQAGRRVRVARNRVKNSPRPRPERLVTAESTLKTVLDTPRKQSIDQARLVGGGSRATVTLFLNELASWFQGSSDD